MSEMTAAMIEQRNEKYLNELQGNIGKYLSFLSIMARFHKYPVADLTSFAIEAPAMFTAVASADFWAKHFHRSISPRAKGVTLIKDGKKTVFYDVSETEAPRNNPLDVRLWQYNESVHKKLNGSNLRNFIFPQARQDSRRRKSAELGKRPRF